MRLLQNQIGPAVTLLNARSLFPKIDELKVVSSLKSPDLICVTETWLNETVDSCLIDIPGFVVCRDDRSYRRGGGVAVFLRSNLCFHNITAMYELPDAIDCLVIDITSFNLLFLCLYVPPSLCSDKLKDIYDSIIRVFDNFLVMKPHYHQMMVGDFNSFDVKSLCFDLDLHDLIVKPTRENAILDHIIVSKELSQSYDVNKVIYDAPLGTSDHLMLTCYPSDVLPKTSHGLRYHKLYDFRQSNMDKLFYHCCQMDWMSLVQSVNGVDQKLHIFLDCLMSLFVKCIPCTYIPMTSNDKGWITPLTKHLINERWAAYRAKDWNRYNFLKNKVRQEK